MNTRRIDGMAWAALIASSLPEMRMEGSLRVHGMNPLNQFYAVDGRHVVIGDQQLEPFRIGSDQVECLLRKTDGGDGIADIFQDPRGGVELIFIVLDKEDGAVSAAEKDILLFREVVCRGDFREEEPEGGSLPLFTVNPKSPLMGLDDAMNHGQTETGSLGLVLGGEKGVEDLVDDGRGNTRSVVGDGQLDIVARFKIQGLGLFLGQRSFPQGESAVFRRCSRRAWKALVQRFITA